MSRLGIAAACAVAALVGGCGGDDASEPGGAAADPATRLTVAVRPDGPAGAVQRRTIECAQLGPNASEPTCRRLAGLTAEQLAPVPADTACTQIYGGPGVARVSGRLRGRPVVARFELSNGCEIARWDRNRVLLGDPP